MSLVDAPASFATARDGARPSYDWTPQWQVADLPAAPGDAHSTLCLLLRICNPSNDLAATPGTKCSNVVLNLTYPTKPVV